MVTFICSYLKCHIAFRHHVSNAKKKNTQTQRPVVTLMLLSIFAEADGW